jgi:hypothetical protein
MECAVHAASNNDSEMSEPVTRQRRPKTQRTVSLMTVLRDLQELKFTIIDLFSFVIDGKEGSDGFHNALFSKNRDSLVGLLEKLIQDDKGRAIVSNWMFPHALRLVCERIHVEMEAAKPLLRMNMGDVCPEFIENWDIQRIMGPVSQDTTPTLRTVLETAGESKASKAKPKSGKSKNRFTALLIIMAQIHFLLLRFHGHTPVQRHVMQVYNVKSKTRKNNISGYGWTLGIIVGIQAWTATS